MTLDSSSHKAVGRFNKNDRFDLQELFEMTNPVPSTSIASVCHTDAHTVDLLLSEFFAQVAHQARLKQHIRLNFKCGWLIIHNGMMQWQHSRELLASHGQDDSTTPSQTTKSSQKVSVLTPSIAQIGRSSSSIDEASFHMANPNPQSTMPRYLGIRESVFYSKSRQQAFDYALKFGKRVSFGSKFTNS